jgi:glycosyltransferase involved in cell wall biosynthesis
MTVRFSVVIPCYNEVDYIADTINSLRAQSFDGGCEIIVVDNNCTDDTAGMARGLGVRVVAEARPGVCNARQKGTEISRGDIVVSADADTIYPTNWLDNVEESFRIDDRVAAVAGPCRYKDGPLWGRVYGRLLFGFLNMMYRLTGRVYYVTATNFAFRRDRWPGYDVGLTQGGDELDLLRKLRGRGVVVYDHANPVWTSPRRLTRGVLYNLFVTLAVYYLLAYALNRFFGRRIIGSAPPYRNDSRGSSRHIRGVTASVMAVFLLLMPFAETRQFVADTSHSLIKHVALLLDPDGD